MSIPNHLKDLKRLWCSAAGGTQADTRDISKPNIGAVLFSLFMKACTFRLKVLLFLVQLPQRHSLLFLIRGPPPLPQPPATCVK